MGRAILVILAISIGLAIIFRSIKEEKENKSEEKIRFECGFDRITTEKINFSTNFIIVIIIFLVFDIEVAIIVPITIREKDLYIGIRQPILFITILTALLIKEWTQGAIDWRK